MGTTINDVVYDYAHVEINVNDKIYTGVLSINYSDPVKPGSQFGTSPRRIGRTTGREEPTASMKLTLQTASEIRTDLGQGYKLKKFGIVCNYAAEGLPLITDELLGVRIVDDKAAHSEGTDGLAEDWELDPWEIIRNGLKSLP